MTNILIAIDDSRKARQSLTSLIYIYIKRQALWGIWENKFCCRMLAWWCLPGCAWRTFHDTLTLQIWPQVSSRQIKPHFYLHRNFCAPYRELKNLPMILDCGWAKEGSCNCQALVWILLYHLTFLFLFRIGLISSHFWNGFSSQIQSMDMALYDYDYLLLDWAWLCCTKHPAGRVDFVLDLVLIICLCQLNVSLGLNTGQLDTIKQNGKVVIRTEHKIWEKRVTFRYRFHIKTHRKRMFRPTNVYFY